MEAIGFDELEAHKAKINRLRGSLSRELIRAVEFRITSAYPEATHAHVVMYPDNVYRVWALSKGNKWITVCDNDVAPTWTSINLDRDIDLLIRLGWEKRIHTYTRTDGVEVHSISLLPLGASRKKLQEERAARASRVEEGK